MRRISVAPADRLRLLVVMPEVRVDPPRHVWVFAGARIRRGKQREGAVAVALESVTFDAAGRQLLVHATHDYR